MYLPLCGQDINFDYKLTETWFCSMSVTDEGLVFQVLWFCVWGFCFVLFLTLTFKEVGWFGLNDTRLFVKSKHGPGCHLKIFGATLLCLSIGCQDLCIYCLASRLAVHR